MRRLLDLFYYNILKLSLAQEKCGAWAICIRAPSVTSRSSQVALNASLQPIDANFAWGISAISLYHLHDTGVGVSLYICSPPGFGSEITLFETGDRTSFIVQSRQVPIVFVWFYSKQLG
jgi:hypothetical protein